LHLAVAPFGAPLDAAPDELGEPDEPPVPPLAGADVGPGLELLIVVATGALNGATLGFLITVALIS